MHTKRCSVKRVQKLEAELNKLESEAELSGLKINFAKSRFEAFGISDQWKHDAAKYLNCSCLTLLFGLLMQQNGELWTRVLNSKYGGWRNLEETGNSAKQCVWWRNVKQAFNQSQQGLVIQNNMRWKVGDGEKVRFWTDKWINQEESLAERYPRLFIISSQQNHTIRQILLFDNEIDTAISFLREVQGQSIQQQQIDIWEWIGDSSGIYTTRSAYNLIWEEIVVARRRIGVWNYGRQRYQAKLRYSLGDYARADCPQRRICEKGTYISTICFALSAVELWKMNLTYLFIASKSNQFGAFPFSPKQHFMQHISIWKLRNIILFANAEFDTNRLFEDAIFIIWTWLRQFEKDFIVHYNQWSKSQLKGIYGEDSWRKALPSPTTIGLHRSSNSVSRVFFDPGQCGLCGVRATKIWVFRQRRGFCGFQRRQCGFSASVGGSVGSTNDNVGVDGAVSSRFRAGGERE
ncbi:hypothetical protein HKD37_17G048512 [Glycine soja]